MRRASILIFLSVALLAPSVSHAAPKKAAPPACAGRDIFTAMKRTDPEGYAKVRAAADASPNTRALLWRIEGKDQPPSYLFGTIHSTDERVNQALARRRCGLQRRRTRWRSNFSRARRPSPRSGTDGREGLLRGTATASRMC